jgi:pimeloyl-ACP methyl ester carboxylesterase
MRAGYIFRAWVMALLPLLSNVAQATPQILQLGLPSSYKLLAYANTDLSQPQSALHAVIFIHGVRRNAEDYYRSGEQLLTNAGLTPRNTLLLAPNFLTTTDPQASDDMPLWPKDRWMQGNESSAGHRGITSFSVLDDLLAYLADRRRFPHLKDVVLIGHSAGAQLMQRYAVVGKDFTSLPVRLVISSPSSYLYLDANRPTATGFAPIPDSRCPGYNRYRYGLEQPPAYLASQGLDAVQLFRRYASRNVTYLVGERDTHADSKVMDHNCAAEAQGPNRLERQLGYLRYEGFLSRTWGVAVAHRQFVIPEAGHNADHLFASPKVAEVLFPNKP